MAENTEKTTRTKKVAPALDFSSIVATKAAAPVRQASVAAQDNPAMAWVRESWNGKVAQGNSNGQPVWLGEGRQVVVPTANAGQVETLIRKAASALGAELNERIGAAVQLEENPRVDGKVQRGMTAVRFAAKSGKTPYQRKPKGESAAK